MIEQKSSPPSAEGGYYVIPINTVKHMMEDDGLSYNSLVHAAPTSKLANIFGADAVMYITVNRWYAKYMVLATQVTVNLTYQIRSGESDEILWETTEEMI